MHTYSGYMKHLQVRLPDELHAALVALAQAERRSLNAQIVVVLERGVDEAKAND